MSDQTRAHLNDIEDNPYQARSNYSEVSLVALSASIKEMGLLQVPVARRVGDKYQLAFGHQRKRAFEMLSREGLKDYDCMPLTIRDLTDREMFEISVTENLKRSELNPLEKAAALKRYMDEFKATSVQAAQLFGIPAGTVRGMVRLLSLPEEAQKEMRAGRLSQTRARVMLQKPETAERQRLEGDDESLDLWERISILIYGKVRDDVPNEVLFNKVKSIFYENKQLRKQVETMNGRRFQSSRLSKTLPYDT